MAGHKRRRKNKKKKWEDELGPGCNYKAWCGNSITPPGKMAVSHQMRAACGLHEGG